MRTEKINRLIQALGKNSPANNPYNSARANVSAENQAAAVATQASDAVSVQFSSSARSAQKSEQPSETSRQEKVNRIREQVQNGTYKSDSIEVAKSIFA